LEGVRLRGEDNIKIYLKEKDVRIGLVFADSRWCPVAGSCEHSNRPMGYIKSGIFIDQMSDRELLKKDSYARYRWLIEAD
jgi:hypothetical protein